MSSYKEKLSILSEMIGFAKIDGAVKEPEYHFLLGVASHLGVDRESFEALFETDTEHIVPKSQADRILQFHRLVLLMNVDQVQEDIEITRLYKIGLGMGLRPTAIDRVLTVMHEYPDKVVPPNVLIDIFKTHYNWGSEYKARCIKHENEVKEENFTRREFTFSSFNRAFYLARDYPQNGIEEIAANNRTDKKK